MGFTEEVYAGPQRFFEQKMWSGKFVTVRQLFTIVI